MREHVIVPRLTKDLLRRISALGDVSFLTVRAMCQRVVLFVRTTVRLGNRKVNTGNIWEISHSNFNFLSIYSPLKLPFSLYGTIPVIAEYLTHKYGPIIKYLLPKPMSRTTIEFSLIICTYFSIFLFSHRMFKTSTINPTFCIIVSLKIMANHLCYKNDAKLFVIFGIMFTKGNK